MSHSTPSHSPLQRHAAECCTGTVVLYNTVAGGVPTEEDVVAAIDDMEKLYDACSAKGRLADPEFKFMKTDGLSAQAAAQIFEKITTQPATGKAV